MQASLMTGHLEYYKKHGINPVHYEMSDLRAHFERRGSLYRTLGIIPLAVRGSRVLEVAPGTGQNSLYIASLEPAEFTLVEPNPVAVRDIKALYAEQAIGSQTPEIVETTFQEFDPPGGYDLAICENWLGDSPAERTLLKKLGSLVAEQGVVAITTVSPVGVLSNVLRKALTCRLDDPSTDFLVRTKKLCEAFGAHLRTLPAMTRTVTDWVQDNVMNPAYFGVLLTIPMAIETLGDRFDVLGSSPRFGSDWRWFKSLAGPGREFNQHVLNEYRRELHNFLDCRIVVGPRDPARNEELEAEAWNLSLCVRALEQAVEAGQSTRRSSSAIEESVRRIVAKLSDLPPQWSQALHEFLQVFGESNPTPARVAGMKQFGSLFGRETVYVSFERNSSRE
jgi:hypothetical protein